MLLDLLLDFTLFSLIFVNSLLAEADIVGEYAVIKQNNGSNLHLGNWYEEHKAGPKYKPLTRNLDACSPQVQHDNKPGTHLPQHTNFHMLQKYPAIQSWNPNAYKIITSVPKVKASKNHEQEFDFIVKHILHHLDHEENQVINNIYDAIYEMNKKQKPLEKNTGYAHRKCKFCEKDIKPRNSDDRIVATKTQK